MKPLGLERFQFQVKYALNVEKGLLFFALVVFEKIADFCGGVEQGNPF